jgi:hypothetical protein
MTKTSLRAVAPLAALTLLLSACGGGDEGIFVDQKDPAATGLTASVSVTASANATLNGSYSSSNIFLNNVTKVNPIGESETCRFRFSSLVQQGGARTMDGDIRYLPGTNALQQTFVSINAIEFGMPGTTGAIVDKPNNRIVFNGAVLTSTQGTGQSITLTGSIPMLGNRPEGC